MEKEVSSQKAASTEKRVLAYSDLGFAVHDKKTKQLKSILQDVSGRVERARGDCARVESGRPAATTCAREHADIMTDTLRSASHRSRA